jgi:hypothetical protein
LHRSLKDQAGRHGFAAARGDTQEVGANLQGYKSVGGGICRRPDLRLEFSAQADSRLRPFARREASTRRPAAVAMRARKPWRRLRTRLLG